MARRPRNIDAWVLAGQSNMQGCGWRRGSLGLDRRVWAFTSAGTWAPAEEPLHRLWESFTPVHQASLRPSLPPSDQGLSDAELARRELREGKGGSGLGIAFGSAMAKSLRRPIGLIPAAHGGTTLEQWSELGKSRGGGSLYGAMLERIARAGGRLRGVLWYQGESDRNERDAPSYAARLDRWIAALRSDTGVPDLPLVVVQIGRVLPPSAEPGPNAGWDMIREALGTLPDRIPFTAVTSAVDLPLKDSIHISTSGLIRLGRRLARLALMLTGTRGISGGPRVSGFEPWTTPDGGRNGLRVRFKGVAGGWARQDFISGFAFHAAAAGCKPPCLVNARVDDEAGDHSILLLLDRPPEAGETVSYGLGPDPRCDLVDRADMPLCSFMPRALSSAN